MSTLVIDDEQRKLRHLEACRRYYLRHTERVKAAYQRYRLRHPERIKVAGRRYRLQHPDQSRRYYLRHPERVKAANDRWRTKNPDKVKARRKKFNNSTKGKLGIIRGNARTRARLCIAGKTMRREPTNLDKQRAAKAKWMRDNRPRMQEYRRHFKRTNIRFALAESIRCSILGALRRRSVKKNTKTEKLLGCQIAHLVRHLESQFLPGMTWENRRTWHIDHKKPLAAFDLTNPEEQKTAFHFTNLQPLWAFENQSKGARHALDSNEDSRS
jgi:hypothetical protein